MRCVLQTRADIVHISPQNPEAGRIERHATGRVVLRLRDRQYSGADVDVIRFVAAQACRGDLADSAAGRVREDYQRMIRLIDDGASRSSTPGRSQEILHLLFGEALVHRFHGRSSNSNIFAGKDASSIIADGQGMLVRWRGLEQLPLILRVTIAAPADAER